VLLKNSLILVEAKAKDRLFALSLSIPKLYDVKGDS
jgi:hypothetical protein